MIELSGVSVRYGDVEALRDVSLTLQSGQVTGLVGMNGAGKSTLFAAIMGLAPLSSGTVRVGGVAPKQARRSGVVSFVPQSEAVDWTFPVSVRDVVMMGRFAHMGPSRRARAGDRAAVAEALERTELADLADRQIGQLSGGQRKRAFVARGIAQGADILLLDEPFAGVDKRTEGTISALLKDLAAEGRTVVVSTHDLAALPDLADEVVLLLRSVVAQGAPRDVLTPEWLARAFGMELGSGFGIQGVSR